MTSNNSALDSLEASSQPLVTFERSLREGEVLAEHSHRRAQLVYAKQGLMQVVTPSHRYWIPPQRAVWMPAEALHAIEALSPLDMCNIYIETSDMAMASSRIHVLQVTPLLTQLIQTMMTYGNDYSENSKASRLAAVIMDQITEQPVADLALPLPSDRRLQKIVDALMLAPNDNQSLDAWAAQVGASTRTLSRLFSEETGMTFSQWRQQRRLCHALELLDADTDMGFISDALGYESQSAFSAMFRRATGVSPGQYRRELVSTGG
ncbi:HTH-type transcriptional regulator NimR [BD1-7 clade bacterium]|uniref:HTH-type transcriptional regulator NimR n=1 Tax=BD1-7 clade bacterium TaxID=2029982 RepID=A0A5S9PRC3_9GAMM|nr:HTH-type transcriptional regulator NimR [BD1-7 clade bacterium]